MTERIPTPRERVIAELREIAASGAMIHLRGWDDIQRTCDEAVTLLSASSEKNTPPGVQEICRTQAEIGRDIKAALERTPDKNGGYNQAALDAASIELHAFFLREGSWYGTKACEEIGRMFMTAYLNAAPSAIAPPDSLPMPKAWVEAAKCPNCEGVGWTARQVAAGEWEQEQCQWCFEKWLALGQPVAATDGRADGLNADAAMALTKLPSDSK